MIIHATGFGPFGDVLVNPSDVLVSEHLASACAALEPSRMRLASQGTLVVGAAATTAAVAELWARAEADADVENDVLVVHFGVDVRAPCVRVERQAFNEATFRLPDAEGLQLESVPVVSCEPLGACRVTTLPVDAIVTAVAAKGHPVAVSDDAGRYLCNYSYVLSLRAAEAANASAAARGDARRFHALFVHIPAEATLALPAVAACVAAVLHACAEARHYDAARDASLQTPSSNI